MTKPRCLWYKARMPGAVRDGTSVVSTNLARVVAERYAIDLVTLRLRGTEDRLAEAGGPFERVHVVAPDNAGGAVRRALYRGLYECRSRLTGTPRAVYYETGRGVRRKIAELCREHDYAFAVLEYFTAAPLAPLIPAPTLLYLHDATFAAISERAQRATSARTRRRLAREADQMRRFEAYAARAARACCLLSRWDQERFEELGVKDTHYLPVLMPAAPAVPRGESSGPAALFVGSLDYEPNRDAAEWFATAILPRVREAAPAARFQVAGAAGDDAAWTRAPGVELLGFVDDLPGAYAEAAVVVAPVRQGTGIKIKVLDALAHGAPVVCTSVAARGTPAQRGGAVVADTAEGFAAAVVRLLGDERERARLASEAQRLMEAEHSGEPARRRALAIIDTLISARPRHAGSARELAATSR